MAQAAKKKPKDTDETDEEGSEKSPRELLDDLKEQNPVLQYYDEKPYTTLAAAFGVGYLLGGGLFTPFTKRLVKIGGKGLILPIAAQHWGDITAISASAVSGKDGDQ